MKKITKLPEYKLLQSLPTKITGLDSKLKKCRQDYTETLKEQDILDRRIKKLYKNGTSDEISEAKESLQNISSKLSRLQNDIDTAQSDVEQARGDLATAQKGYAEKVIPIVNDKLKDFRKSLAETERLNNELKEIAQLSSFGTVTGKFSTIPQVPFLDLKGKAAYPATKVLDRKIESWN
jgi:chromosome segregation ATPase